MPVATKFDFCQKTEPFICETENRNTVKISRREIRTMEEIELLCWLLKLTFSNALFSQCRNQFPLDFACIKGYQLHCGIEILHSN